MFFVTKTHVVHFRVVISGKKSS